MLGSAEEAAVKARREIATLQLARTSGAAVDLGAGLGFHALALAEIGYDVVAVDSCVELLGEFRNQARSLPVRTVEGDLTAFRRYVPGPYDVILCMGDTLTHLPSSAAVETLIADVTEALVPGGVFCATFRDYTVALEGDERFIPVRSDETRSLTCFLEYGPDTVTVHDLLHERGSDGWTFQVSSYPKLRLDPVWVAGLFEERGSEVKRDTGPGGMVRLVARAV
jgi:SAM-dependent methyltransferase